MTAITYKRDVTVLDIQSTNMLGSYGFLSRTFKEFENHKLSVDVLASSEVSVSLTMDEKQDDSQVEHLIKRLQDCADITRKDDKSILTLITDVRKSSEVLATVFRIFSREKIPIEMMSQGASKVNISFVVNSEDLNRAIARLHSCFFEGECVVQKWTPEEEGEGQQGLNGSGQAEIDKLGNSTQQGIETSESKVNGSVNLIGG